MFELNICLSSACNNIAQEAYVVSSMLSYARRYWRRCLARGTHSELGLQLLRVLKQNPRRARESCRKGAKAKKSGRFRAVRKFEVFFFKMILQLGVLFAMHNFLLLPDKRVVFSLGGGSLQDMEAEPKIAEANSDFFNLSYFFVECKLVR